MHRDYPPPWYPISFLAFFFLHWGTPRTRAQNNTPAYSSRGLVNIFVVGALVLCLGRGGGEVSQSCYCCSFSKGVILGNHRRVGCSDPWRRVVDKDWGVDQDGGVRSRGCGELRLMFSCRGCGELKQEFIFQGCHFGKSCKSGVLRSMLPSCG